MGDAGRGGNHQTAIREQRERDGATGRSSSMTQQPRGRAGKQDGADLPAQRKFGGGAGLEMEWRLEQPDGFSRGFSIADPRRTRSDGVERNAPALAFTAPAMTATTTLPTATAPVSPSTATATERPGRLSSTSCARGDLAFSTAPEYRSAGAAATVDGTPPDRCVRG